MKLLLHIGTEKTGTTSAQKWAASNRAELARQGVFYSELLGPSNHRKIYLWALPPKSEDEGFAQIGLTTAAARAAFRAELPDALAGELAAARAASCHTFVISSELCHSRLLRPAQLLRLRDLLAPHVAQIEILCSLRPQIDMAVSLASTLARNRLPVRGDYFDQVTATRSYYNFDQLVGRWEAVFGAAAVTLLPFRRRPDMVAYLIAALGLEADRLSPPQRHNEAIDVRVMALVNALDNPARRAGDPFSVLPLNWLPCEQKLQPGLEVARAVQARFAASNAQLLARRDDIRAEDLQPDWRRYDAPGNLHLLEDDCGFAEPLGLLISLLNQRNGLATILQRLAECDRALTMHNPGEAEQALELARQGLKHYPPDSPFATRLARIGQRIAHLRRKLEKAG